MIRKNIARGVFHESVTKKMLSLILKEGDGKNLTNWQPFTLLIVIYKVFAKTLHKQLQPMLSDIIIHGQMVFLPLRFILDYIVLIQEILH